MKPKEPTEQQVEIAYNATIRTEREAFGFPLLHERPLTANQREAARLARDWWISLIHSVDGWSR